MRDLRRTEFAIAAFGGTVFLVALVFELDVARFHRDVLISAVQALPRGELHLQGVLLLLLALFDLFAFGRLAISVSRGVAAHRRVRSGLPVSGTRAIGGRTVWIVPTARPLAFCAGLLRPRVYVSEGALAALSPESLAAAVAHESHHACRRDPLRILIARAIGDAYALGALPRREQALAELAADDAAARSGGRAPLAAALLAFEEGGIAPGRVDRLTGADGRSEVPGTAVVASAGVVIAGLVGVLAVGLLVHDRPPVCIPLASAPLWFACAVMARLAVMMPAWLGWRRASAYLA
ncbi:MAG TPA: M48 family metalloprotease [Solirubrobacter sp.]|nr:M48 family metalloprotease [Solirubrobacter sp.]